MRAFIFIVAYLLSSRGLAFLHTGRPRFASSHVQPRSMAMPTSRVQPLFMGGGFEPVPMDKEKVCAAASVTTGIFGLFIAGVPAALIFAATANFLAKKDNDAGEAVRGVGRATIDAYNYLTKLNQRFDISGKVTTSVNEAVDKAAAESENVGKVKDILAKVSEINTEFGLLDKGKEALAVAAVYSDKALAKAEEINEKYDLIKVTKEAAIAAAEKVKESTAKK